METLPSVELGLASLTVFIVLVIFLLLINGAWKYEQGISQSITVLSLDCILLYLFSLISWVVAFLLIDSVCSMLHDNCLHVPRHTQTVLDLLDRYSLHCGSNIMGRC